MLLLVSMAESRELFVKPSSVNHALGTQERPFTTLEQARDSIRNDARRSAEPTTVYVMEDMYLDAPFTLDSRDSGTAEAPVTYASYFPGGAVDAKKKKVSGGKLIDPKSFKPVMLPSRIPGGFVTELFSQGLNTSELGALGNPYPTSKLELFLNGMPMTLARDPNIADDPLKTWMWAGYENMTEIQDDNTTFTLHDSERGVSSSQMILTHAYLTLNITLTVRGSLWSEALTHGTLWLHGFFKFDWRDTYIKIKDTKPNPNGNHVPDSIS